MIVVDPHGDAEPDRPRDAARTGLTGRHLLSACAGEAERHAAGLSGLDAALGAILSEGRMRSDDLDPALLQQVDLLRQEANGLARLLRLIVESGVEDREIDPSVLRDCLPTANQRHRVLGP